MGFPCAKSTDGVNVDIMIKKIPGQTRSSGPKGTPKTVSLVATTFDAREAKVTRVFVFLNIQAEPNVLSDIFADEP